MQISAGLDFSEAASQAHGRMADTELLACDHQGTPLLQRADNGSWLPTRLLVIPAEETRAEYPVMHPRVEVALSGTGRRTFNLAGRDRTLSTRPRMVELYEGGSTFERLCWSGTAGVRISVEFPAATTERLMHDDSRPVRFANHFELFDENVARLAGDLAQHAHDGHPHGSLYSEGISLSLISMVLAHYGSGSPIRTTFGGRRFNASQTRRVRDYIENNLGDDLRIEQVARQVEISPHIFARRFRSTFDQSPHQYVLKRRIERAEWMLKQGYRGSIAQLALSLGFSTHAHFTAAFKRMRGIAPKSLRAE